MKRAVLQTLMGLPVAGAIALTALPATAQFFSVPVSNGNFSLVRNAAGTANEFSGPITLLSPVGTITVTGNPPLFYYQPGILVNTDTPLAVSMEGLIGSVNLQDGRTANFGPNSGLGVETLATVTGITNWNPYSTLPTGANATFNIRNGYLSFPEANLSAYPTSQFLLPVTNGTPFSVTVPVGAGPETLTINGALTPLGTTNLTLTYPLLVNPTNSYLYYEIGTTNTPVRIGGIATGTVDLLDGRVATVNNVLVNLTATARVTSDTGTYIQPDVYTTPVTLEGTFTGGTISIPESAVVPPTQPPSQSPQPTPTQPQIPIAPPISVIQTESPNPAIGGRPEPIIATPPTSVPTFQLGSSNLELFSTLELGGEIGEFVLERQQVTPTPDMPEVDRSSLEFSRIHPAVNIYN
jgi:hypothetical protein